MNPYAAAAHLPGMPADPTDAVGARVVAKIIDSLAALPFGFISLWWIYQSMDRVTVADPVAYCNDVGDACIPWGNEVLLFSGDQSFIFLAYLPGLVWSLLLVALEGKVGWTPGKLVMGLRVVRADNGEAIGFGKSLIRAILWVVDGLCFGIVALFTAWNSPGHQRLGGRASSTLVVRKDAAGHQPAVPGLTSGHNLQPYPPPSYSTPAMGGPPTYPQSPPGQQSYASDVPTWDSQRGTYILYDTASQSWLEYDQHAQNWKPIST